MKLRYKISLGIILALILAPLFAWSIFQANEYLTGNTYIHYLDENKEVIRLDGSSTFELLSDDLQSTRLMLVGEIHGFENPQKTDPLLFGHLNRNHDFNIYLLEMDQSQAYFMNRYNETGDDSILTEVLSNWIVGPGRYSIDYRKRFQALRDHYQNIKQFRYIGNDVIADIGLLSAHLQEIAPGLDLSFESDTSDSLYLSRIASKLDSHLSASTISDGQKAELNYLLNNIQYSLNDVYREEVLTSNLLDLYEIHDLKKEKVYGYFGIGHVFEAAMEGGYKAMAARLKEQDAWFKSQMLTINTLFEDSHQLIRSHSLPSFLQDEGPYTRLSFSFDNLLFSYLYGIEDLKRVTRSNSTTLFRINSDDSPYRQTTRLLQMTQIIPVGGLLNADPERSSSEYTDYILFFRDSDWAEPISINGLTK